MNDAEEVLLRLRSSILGESLTATQVNLLAECAECASASTGAILFAEGDPASALRIVCSGRVALDMHVPSRGTVRILTLGPRDLLGWSTLVGDGSMSATAIVVEDAELLEFQADSLQALCEGNAELGRTVMLQVARALAQRLSQTRLQLLDLFAETEPRLPAPAGKGQV